MTFHSFRKYPGWLISCVFWTRTLLFLHSQDTLAPAGDEIWRDASLVEDEAPVRADEVSTLLEELERLRESKIAINTATFQEFQPFVELGWITEAQVHTLLEYVQKYGPIERVEMLQGIPGWTPELIQRMAPYLRFDLPASGPRNPLEWLSDVFRNSRQILVMMGQRRLELERGYWTSDSLDRFLGDPWRIQIRYRLYHSQFRAGITMEKDPGEPLFSGPLEAPLYTPWKGFDYASGFLELRRIHRWIPVLIIGDYNVRWGQGLVFWTDFAWRKSSRVLGFARGGESFSGYTSVVEMRGMRGSALQVRPLPWVTVEGFASRRHLSATIYEDPEEDSIRGAGVVWYGYHRNLREWRKRNALQVEVLASRLRIHGRPGEIAGMIAQTRFSLPLGVYREYLYNRFYFRGDRTIHYAIQWSVYPARGVRWFGEWAHLIPGNASGVITGILLQPARRFHGGILYRNISPKYFSLFAQPFTEYYRGQNEEGIYLALSLTPKRGFQVEGYIDLYRHPWFRFQRDLPSYGKDWLLRLQYSFTSGSYAYLQWRHESYLRTFRADPFPLDTPGYQTYGYLRLHVRVQTPYRFTVQFRWQGSYFLRHSTILSAGDVLRKAERGSLTYIQVQFFTGRRLSHAVRIVYFATPSWNTRIYAYEPALPYTFPVVPHYGRGMRWVWRAGIRASPSVRFWIRLAQTQWLDRSSVGSGIYYVPIPRRTEIGLQLQIRV